MEGKTLGIYEEIRHLDEKDRRILNILAENARTKLTKMAKEIGLSVDSTKKRLEKLEKDSIIDRYTIQVNTSRIGLPVASHIYIKLQNIEQESYDAMIAYLRKEPKVIDLMAMLGDYDLYIVMLGKDNADLEEMKMALRKKFANIIAEWKEVLVAKLYKLEEYRF